MREARKGCAAVGRMKMALKNNYENKHFESFVEHFFLVCFVFVLYSQFCFVANATITTAATSVDPRALHILQIFTIRCVCAGPEYMYIIVHQRERESERDTHNSKQLSRSNTNTE